MGTFSVPIQVGDAQGTRFQLVEALVGTGATCLVLPRDLLVSLGYQPSTRRTLALADEHIVEYDIALVLLRLGDEALPTPCVFGEEGTEPLLGSVALESFLLAADPVDQRLLPVVGRLK